MEIKFVQEDSKVKKSKKFVLAGLVLAAITTDYAKATGAYKGDPSAGYGGWWWLRSPNCYFENSAHEILNYGHASDILDVDDTIVGVVPAL